MKEKYTLAEAHAALRAAIPRPKPINLCLETWSFGRDERLIDSGWRIWDGDRFHNGPTLSTAVDKCLAFHAEPKAVPLDVAQAVIDEATEISADPPLELAPEDDVLAALAVTELV